MRKKNRKPPHCKIVLRPPDLDQTKSAVLNSLSSPQSRRNYKFAMEQFITWYCSEPRLSLNRSFVRGTGERVSSLEIQVKRGNSGNEPAFALADHRGPSRVSERMAVADGGHLHR